MAYIAPNSLVKICSGIPWNDTYQDTVYYANATTQFNAISAKAKYTFTAQSYQRAGKNSIKLNVLADNLYDCNYMMFQNTSYSTRWFYAFITKIDYINNDTTLIEYEIDVLQTWAFDYTLEKCFVEREHSEHDYLYENLLEEDVETGELICTRQSLDNYGQQLANGGSLKIIVCATWKGIAGAVSGNVHSWTIDDTTKGYQYGGVYSGLFYTVCDNYEDATALIDEATTQMVDDKIEAIFMYFGDFIVSQPAAVARVNNVASILKPYADYLANNRSLLDGYVPRNKKLWAYPFLQLLVTDGGKQQIPLKFEFFSDSTHAKFDMFGETSINPTLALSPHAYKGFAANDAYNTMLMTNFPMCAWSVDMFRAYIAQTYGPNIGDVLPARSEKMRSGFSTAATVSGVVSAAAPAVGAAVGTLAGSSGVGAKAGGILADISDSVHQISNTYLAGAQSHGQTTDTALVNFKFKGFHFYTMSIRAEYAAIIDDYFDMFGYATKRVKVPNTHSRPHWNYVKTIGCKIAATIPFDHESLICSIFDRGVTFWNSIADYGDYSLNNSPT